MNNMLKAVRLQAYGYRDDEYFFLNPSVESGMPSCLL
ncbi:MAG: hypothetical protein IAA97_04260 [Spirochaetes bacterium]|uniref:Uncharacterized protein n=1 Tax=Candidatus Ornithospirochaeta stercoripullorum TaxID=2840899 RepID=A0A9D9E0X9_9SPIO|nr:hypothetical protein [Candidatus Ornithospirochaeta stercoripullorum]